MSLIMFTGNLHAIISAILLQLVLFCKWKILHIRTYSKYKRFNKLKCSYSSYEERKESCTKV